MNQSSARYPRWLRQKLHDASPQERDEIVFAWRAAGSLVESEPSDDVVRGWAADVWAVVERETIADARVAPGKGDIADSRQGGVRLIRAAPLRWLAVAAVVVLLVAVGASLWLRAPVSVYAPVGQSLSLTLPDGSLVELNAGTKLRHPRRFSLQGRDVHLQGEAFFVVQEVGSPFRIETFNAEVTVLGTSFNVRAWPDEREPATEVTLEAGRVRLAGLDGMSAVEMEAGEYSALQRGAVTPLEPVPVQVSTATAWRERGFVLVDRSLAVVLAEVQRRFAVQVGVEQADMLDEMLSVVSRVPASPDTILQDIGQYLGFVVTQTEDGYFLRRP